MSAFLKASIAFIEVILYITGVFTADTTINYGGNEYVAQEISAPMAIVEDGTSNFVIVTEENPDATTKTAVKELQTYIKKISGAKIKSVTENEAKPEDKAIILGKTMLEKEIVEINRKKIAQDGFKLYSDGNHLFISGADSRGTLYGVYTFLEDYLGVRWFTPELEVVPENEIVFEGYGFGHGIGLSQYGAKGFADSGYTYDEILLHYFPGTMLGKYN